MWVLFVKSKRGIEYNLFMGTAEMRLKSPFTPAV
jgi:hypothetical protein